MLLEYDDMANEQRQVIYSQRDTILYSEDITELLDSMRESVIENQVATYIPADAPEEQWDLEGLEKSVVHDFGMQVAIKKWVEEDTDLEEEELIKKILIATSNQYKAKCEPIGTAMRDFEKQILLQVIDNAWKEHLGAVEYLRQGIGLRGYASKNPKLEFRRESFELFEELLNKIRVEAIRFLSRVEIEFESPDDLIKDQKANKEQVYEHKEAKSYPVNQNDRAIPHEEREETPTQGNRRLRRYEAKMARKRKLKD